MRTRDYNRIIKAAERIDEATWRMYACNAIYPNPADSLRNKYIEFWNFPKKIRDYGLEQARPADKEEFKKWRVIMLLWFAELGGKL